MKPRRYGEKESINDIPNQREKYYGDRSASRSVFKLGPASRLIKEMKRKERDREDREARLEHMRRYPTKPYIRPHRHDRNGSVSSNRSEGGMRTRRRHKSKHHTRHSKRGPRRS